MFSKYCFIQNLINSLHVTIKHNTNKNKTTTRPEMRGEESAIEDSCETPPAFPKALNL